MSRAAEIFGLILGIIIGVIIKVTLVVAIPLFITFLILQLCGVISWGWIFIFLPLIAFIVAITVYLTIKVLLT